MSRIITGEIARAFDDASLHYVYQPVVDLSTGQIPYVEALIRWDHPDHGVLNPASFLPLIHAEGLSRKLAETGVEQVLTDLPALRAAYGTDLGIALNLSQHQLADADGCAQVVLDAVERHGVGRDVLNIEVVEDLDRDGRWHAAEALSALRSAGVGVILDDFGTGASSLSALTDMEYDGLKIDRAFVNGVVRNRTARAVVEAIVAFGLSEGITVVAEGIESTRDFEAVRALGCSLGQGFLLGKPRPVSASPPQWWGKSNRLSFESTSQHASVIDSHDTAAEIDDILAACTQVNPRCSREEFPETLEALSVLDARASAVGAAGVLVRCEVGRRATLAATYAGVQHEAIEWGTRTSMLAEDVGEYGRSAEVLAIISSCMGLAEPPAAAPDAATVTGSQSARIEAITRAINLRVHHPMDAERRDFVDNAIGAAFANFGLTDHARQWWRERISRQGVEPTIGAALCCLNLITIELERHEVAPGGGANAMPDYVLTSVERTLQSLESNPTAPRGAAALLRCRFELQRGDIAAAEAALAESNPADAALPTSLAFRSQALLARAKGDAQGFLKHTSANMLLLGTQPLFIHHELVARELHAQALLETGHFEEAAAALASIIRSKKAIDGHKLVTMFDWIRLNIDLNDRHSELFGVLEMTTAWPEGLGSRNGRPLGVVP